MRQEVYRVAFDEASAELSEILNRFEQLRSRKDRVEKVVEALKPLLAGNESPAPALSLHAEWAPASVQTPTSAPVPIHTPVQVPVCGFGSCFGAGSSPASSSARAYAHGAASGVCGCVDCFAGSRVVGFRSDSVSGAASRRRDKRPVCAPCRDLRRSWLGYARCARIQPPFQYWHCARKLNAARLAAGVAPLPTPEAFSQGCICIRSPPQIAVRAPSA